MNKNLTLTVSMLLVGFALSACALTLKSGLRDSKRAWLDIRERVVIAYNDGKLDQETVINFILADEAFAAKYTEVAEKVLNDQDVSEDEIKYLQDMIEAWKDRIP